MSVKAGLQMARRWICSYSAAAPLSPPCCLGTNPVFVVGILSSDLQPLWCQQQNGVCLIKVWVKRTLVFGLQCSHFMSWTFWSQNKRKVFKSLKQSYFWEFQWLFLISVGGFKKEKKKRCLADKYNEMYLFKTRVFQVGIFGWRLSKAGWLSKKRQLPKLLGGVPRLVPANSQKGKQLLLNWNSFTQRLFTYQYSKNILNSFSEF